jgi:isoamylase
VDQGRIWSATDGSPNPLGATWLEECQAFNFAIYSKYATAVTLLCYGATDFVEPVFRREFDLRKNRTGRTWHVRISGEFLRDAKYYAYRIDGPPPSADRFERHAFNPRKILLDPYTRAVFFPPEFDRGAAIDPGANDGRAPLGVLSRGASRVKAGSPVFDSARRPRHDSALVIYEMHLSAFTKDPSSGVPETRRGTYLGVIDKIPHLLALGVTAVELMPVFQFDRTEPNYWGYMPLAFFSLQHDYASIPGEQTAEFRTMVAALHEAGIEVYLDVVYNHTNEGDELGPVFSFKGIDNSTYYMASDDPAHPYADYSGTGNTLHCANAAVRQLVVDSLRYCVCELGVDGFRFDLASVFSRNTDGSIAFEDPPIFGEIAMDPYLSTARLIAEPWEGNPRFPNYELGDERAHNEPFQRSFPGIDWRQWNDRFRETARRFVRGDPGYVSDLMTRIHGSSDVFPAGFPDSYRPYQSVNYVAAHDGPTLYDLVAYTTREGWNCGGPDGEEGVGADVMRLRKQQAKNFCSLIMLSNGTPMFRAGDEFLQTQGGNGNPYNVDSPTTWLNWRRLEEHRDVFRFIAMMIAFRKRHPSIARSTFWEDDVRWYGVGPSPDLSPASRSVAWHLKGEPENDDDLYVMLNAYWEPLTFAVQADDAPAWLRIVDTSLDSPDDILDEVDSARPIGSASYAVAPRSIAVLSRKRRAS